MLGLFPNLFYYAARKMVVPAEVKGDTGAGMSNGERGRLRLHCYY